MDLAIATSFLAICLGTDPIRVGATPEQKAKYIGPIAEEGLIVAYGVTEPEAGSMFRL
jgi:alkylation response protein AidB-like acyl-CoA dehydrogenase